MKAYLSPLTGLLAVALLSGCMNRSNPEPAAPNLADRIEQSAQAYADEAAERKVYADHWRQGEAMVKAGTHQQDKATDTIRKAERDKKRAEKELKKYQERLAKAEKILTDAKAAQTAGRTKVAEGKRLKAEAEAGFHTAYPGALMNH